MRDLAFEHVSFQPLEMADAAGLQHRFAFVLRHLGDRVALDAFEVHDEEPGGYAFQIIDEPEVDLFELMGRLVARMRRALGYRHLVEGDFGLAIADMTVRARVDSDQDADFQTPMLIIDGREVTWDHFGRMLMTFEGWQFKLEIKDRSEEV